jgi:hypothetical protein
VLAASRADQQRVGTDFHVFWQAGYNFAHGLPLYDRVAGARTFIYPPFAAQAFQLLAVFPMKVSAGLFYLANLALIVGAAWLTRDIVRQLRRDKRLPRLALVLAMLFSGNFILNNLNLLQVNLIVFVLSLLAVRGMIMGRASGVAWAVIATALKITPIFFVIWAVIRGGWRVLRMAVVVGLVALCSPVAQRGIWQGLTDLTTYYEGFLHQFTTGTVVTTYTNQNLAAMVYRAAVPPELPGQFRYDYLPALATAAPTLHHTLAIMVLLAFLLNLWRLTRTNRRPTPLEITSVFLTGHLLSGITWKAHLVTLLFVFYSFLSLDPRPSGRPARLALTVAWAGIAVIGLTGRDLVGHTVHHYIGGYSLITWVMLMLLVLSIVWSGRASDSPVRTTPPSDEGPGWTLARGG